MQIICSPTQQSGIDALAATLSGELQQNKRVLWFVSGGSNIASAVQIMIRLDTASSERLTIALADERYGAVGHSDSNWQQLLDAGVDFKQARCVPVLYDGQGDIEQTAQHYSRSIEEALQSSDVVISLLGMGNDGHIAGILPNSPATEATGLVVAYQSEPYARITLTFEAILRCNIAYLFAFGDNKLPMLTQLEEDVSLADQPAQIIKQLTESYVYNDQIGEQS